MEEEIKNLDDMESAEELAEDPIEEPVDEPAEEPTEESAEEPTEEQAEEPVEEETEEPVEEEAEEPAEEPVEEPTEEPVEEPAEEQVEEPTEEPAEEPVEEEAEEPVEEEAEEPIEEQPAKPARALPVFEEDEEDEDDFVPAPIHTRPRRLDDEDLDRMFEPVDEDEVPKKKKKKKKKKKRKPMDPTVQPVKAGKLFIAQLLIKIPIIGIIFALIYMLNKKANKNIRTYARLALIWHVIGLALFIFFLATDGFGYLISWIFDLFNIKGIKF